MINWSTRFKKQLKIIMTRWAPLVVFTVLGITVINLLWLIPALKNIRSSASLLNIEVADRLRSNMELGLEASLSQLNAVAREIAAEPDRKQIVFNRFLNNNSHFQNIAIADRTGREIMRIDRIQEMIANILRDHSRDPFFYLALEDSSNFWNVQMSADDKPYTTLAVPVKYGGSINSVIIADLNIGDLMQQNGMARFRGVSYVVDRDGFIILSSDASQVAKHQNVENRRIVQKVVIDGHEADGLSPEDMYINDNGVPMFAVGLPISIASWGMFIEQPKSQAFEGEFVIVIFAVITWILGMGIIFVIIRGNYNLGKLNDRLNDFLKENYDVGKILVRRDIELTEANTRLMALDVSKSEFVSVAAHQLRTPITGIRWSFSTLLDREMGEINSEQQKILEDGLKSSVRMIALINDLLNVARIEEGRFGLRFKKYALGIIMQGVADRHRKAIDEKGILFFLDIQPGIPSLDLDEEKMNIALDNIFDNAIKYTSPGGTITAKIREEKHIVHVAISDTGIGIPKNQIDKLFAKFFRADNAMRFQTSGSGLGLYVVKNIIETHGGAIHVESEENKGTTISFTLPIPSSD